MTVGHRWVWVAFWAVVITLLAIDMLVVNRRSRVLTVREATRWSAVLVVAGPFVLLGILIWLALRLRRRQVETRLLEQN